MAQPTTLEPVKAEELARKAEQLTREAEELARQEEDVLDLRSVAQLAGNFELLGNLHKTAKRHFEENFLPEWTQLFSYHGEEKQPLYSPEVQAGKEGKVLAKLQTKLEEVFTEAEAEAAAYEEDALRSEHGDPAARFPRELPTLAAAREFTKEDCETLPVSILAGRCKAIAAEKQPGKAWLWARYAAPRYQAELSKNQHNEGLDLRSLREGLEQLESLFLDGSAKEKAADAKKARQELSRLRFALGDMVVRVTGEDAQRMAKRRRENNVL